MTKRLTYRCQFWKNYDWQLAQDSEEYRNYDH